MADPMNKRKGPPVLLEIAEAVRLRDALAQVLVNHDPA